MALSRPVKSTFRNGVSSPLWAAVPVLDQPHAKNIFLILHWNFPCCNWCLLPFILSLCVSLLYNPIGPLKLQLDPPPPAQPSLPKAEQIQSSALLVSPVHQSPKHCVHLLLDPLQFALYWRVNGTPRAGSPGRRQKKYVTEPTDCVLANAARSVAELHCRKCVPPQHEPCGGSPSPSSAGQVVFGAGWHSWHWGATQRALRSYGSC